MKFAIEGIVSLCKDLGKIQFTDDFKELIDLTLVYIGGMEGIAFRQPCAMHRAWWMAKLLYALKMIMLGDKIENEQSKSAVFA